ncbi:transposase IS66 family protein, partial [Escherichia coli 3-020-07_S3_C1]
LTEEALKRIGELYAIEAEIRGMTAEQRLAERQLKTKPLLKSLESWLREKMKTLSRHSELAKAFAYALNQWPALTYYADDGWAEADNNIAENALRMVSLGRKNSYDLCQILSPKRPYAAPGASLYRGLKNLKQSDCILDFTNSYSGILAP